MRDADSGFKRQTAKGKRPTLAEIGLFLVAAAG